LVAKGFFAVLNVRVANVLPVLKESVGSPAIRDATGLAKSIRESNTCGVLSVV
jgi:hypothetical protein